jgi:N4-gp56 family major capsid protein
MPITALEAEVALAQLNTALQLIDPQPNYVFDQFATKDIDGGAFTEGDTVKLNRYPMLGNNGLTEEDRRLSETSTIGTTNSTRLTVQQITVVLQEYSGPHDGTNVGPLAVTEKALRQAMAKWLDSGDPLSFMNSIGGMALKNDHDKVHDRILSNLMRTTTNKYNPDGVADGSTATTSTGSKFDSDDLKGLKETMQTSLVPTFPDGFYHAVIPPRLEKHLKQDPDFKEACYYYKPDTQFKGALTEFEGFRFWTSTNMPVTTINSLTAHEGVVFGPQSIGYGEGNVPLQIRRNKNDDYDRFLYLIWLVYRGYSLLDSRFIYKIRTFAA